MTFDIPASAGFTDLTQSKLVLDIQLDVKDGTTDVPAPATFGIEGEMVGAKSILRHSRVKSRQHGLMSERRHINVIDANLDWYGSHRESEDAESLFGNSTNKNYGKDNKSFLPDNPWLMIQRPVEGAPAVTALPTTRRAEIPISLRHIDQMASIKQFPNVAVGELHYEVELEDQFNVVAPVVLNNRGELFDPVTGAASVVGSTGAPFITSKTTSQWNRPPKVGDVVDVVFRETTSGSTKQYQDAVISAVTAVGGKYEIEFNDGAGLATTAIAEAIDDARFFYNPIRIPDVAASSSAQYGTVANPIILDGQSVINDRASHHGCPYYPGMPVVASLTHNNTKSQGNRTIESVAIVGDAYHIVLSNFLTVTNAQPITDIYLASRDFRQASNDLLSVEWRVNEAYIQLAEIKLAPQQMEAARRALGNLEIPWVEQRLLQKDMPSTSVHTDVVHALPNCAALAVLTPQNLRLLSGWDNCERYRFAINGVETTNRDVRVYDAANPNRPLASRQLHNHLLKKYWANHGKALSKYDANVSDYTSADNKSLHSIFPLVTPLIPAEQTIQVQLFADNGNMSQKSLFYVFTHPRMLKISNGAVSVM